MGRLVRDDRKTTVTQITTRYNQGVQSTISERTTRQTLKQMGSSSRRLKIQGFLRHILNNTEYNQQ